MVSVKRKPLGDATEGCESPPMKQRREHGNDNENGLIDEAVTCLHQVSYPEGYQPSASSNQQREAKPAKEFPFSLDPFQQEAIKCLENGESVMVSAHTSAGKTVVGLYAIAMSLLNKQRVIYTSPIKALSNQKYREFKEEFSDVGLMTGDVTIDPNASCLVMTTEIWRSMQYKGSEITREVAWIIFDEVHYMRDRERGVVWEESIVMAPRNSRFVFLSATVPNAKEFADWVAKVLQQPCHIVYTDYRPTPLQHYIFPCGGDGLYLVVDEKECYVSCKTANSFISAFRDNIFFSQQMAKMDLSDDDEKVNIETIFWSAMDMLSDDDKKLPQVSNMLPLLKRGIGVHHSGLLPILKEVIEILFQEGFIKLWLGGADNLRSLWTFVPSNGEGTCMAAPCPFTIWISSGEYIQMSGRAGRRGIDDRGICILMVDEKLEPSTVKFMLKGSADSLNSAFHLSYNMLLNQIRAADADPENLLRNSFYQFQADRAIPDLEPGRLVSIQCTKSDEDSPSFSLQDEVTWGVIINFERVKVASEDDANKKPEEASYTVDILTRCRVHKDEIAKKTIRIVPLKEPGEPAVISVPISQIDSLSSVRLIIPKDLLPLEARENTLKKVSEVLVRFAKEGVPILDPEDDMRASWNSVFHCRYDTQVQSSSYRKATRRIEALENLFEKHKVARSPLIEQKLKFLHTKKELTAKIRSLKKAMKSSSVLAFKDELKARKRTLRRLGYITSDDVVELKGKVACEISSAEELTLTELMFNGVLKDIRVEEMISLLSCFVWQEKLQEAQKPRDELGLLFTQVQETARKVAKVQLECKVQIDIDNFVSSFRPDIMEAVYAWARGSKFYEIMEMTPVFEGSLIRAIRRLEELLQQLIQAAKSIGEKDLEVKFEEAVTKIKRDIVFAASLYL
ncbi:hypothetical protein SASPL_125370 [Salvia splendens]|uniref:Helicase ATP-binding domain-containing protein n=1 Tax=Salvia splendens TaxID=180675 RepID=A0A8X8XF57_SALSN|nr:hypothetical protein SASPL_125370 [Salvia splendens]